MDFVLTISGLTTLTKLVVDGIKIAVPTASSAAVVGLAFAFAQLFTFLASIRNGEALTGPVASGDFMLGVIIWGAAIGLTEAQKVAEAKRQEARAS